MSNALRTQIQTFAAQFAAEVLKALRNASLEDILTESTAHRATAAGPVKRGRGRPKGTKDSAPRAKRGSTSRPQAAAASSTPKRGRGRPKGSKDSAPRAKRAPSSNVLDSITAYVRQHPGTSGEAARKALKIERSQWSPAVSKAITEKKIRKEGERRSTKYWAT